MKIICQIYLGLCGSAFVMYFWAITYAIKTGVAENTSGSIWKWLMRGLIALTITGLLIAIVELYLPAV